MQNIDRSLICPIQDFVLRQNGFFIMSKFSFDMPRKSRIQNMYHKIGLCGNVHVRASLLAVPDVSKRLLTNKRMAS